MILFTLRQIKIFTIKESTYMTRCRDKYDGLQKNCQNCFKENWFRKTTFCAFFHFLYLEKFCFWLLLSVMLLLVLMMEMQARKGYNVCVTCNQSFFYISNKLTFISMNYFITLLYLFVRKCIWIYTRKLATVANLMFLPHLDLSQSLTRLAWEDLSF